MLLTPWRRKSKGSEWLPLFKSSYVRFSAIVAKGNFPEALLDQANRH